MGAVWDQVSWVEGLGSRECKVQRCRDPTEEFPYLAHITLGRKKDPFYMNTRHPIPPTRIKDP